MPGRSWVKHWAGVVACMLAPGARSLLCGMVGGVAVEGGGVVMQYMVLCGEGDRCVVVWEAGQGGFDLTHSLALTPHTPAVTAPLLCTRRVQVSALLERLDKAGQDLASSQGQSRALQDREAVRCPCPRAVRVPR